MKQITLITILLLSIMSCKDDDPVAPQEDKSNNTYTVKAKLVNGTTGNALYTDSKVYLEVERLYGLGFVEREALGSMYMKDDGSMEFTYKHSAMADKYGARVRLYSNAFSSGYYLPNNQDIDTTIYRSSMGRVKVHLKDVEPYNKLYYAYKISNDSLTLDVQVQELASFMTINL